MDGDTENKEEKPEHVVIKNCADLQRMRLEKLMKNIDKPVVIPERPKQRGVPTVPDFVRNVMGSSAGAGSGEFHVYRHLRRKEYARQKYMKEKGERERLDEEYHEKLEANKAAAEAKTAKKRAKRMKKKLKLKNQSKKPKVESSQAEADSESSEEDSSEEIIQEVEKTSEIDNEHKNDNPLC
ncbi:hypothetical protein WA026_000392 [Henosepilachna vigintioctopunctata]|uniref:PRKR-interacting protein 1 n=1 Tax=Henosepilachna vigintioctopunctata TaxID=420089 RepID=A0AAW1V3P8_9CUCU